MTTAMKSKTEKGCGRCHGPLDGEGREDTFVLYLYPGERDRYQAGETRQPRRISVHARCIADEAAEGRLLRVSPFAYEVVS